MKLWMLFMLHIRFLSLKITLSMKYIPEKITHWLWIRSERVLERGYVMLLSMRNLILPVIS